MKINTHHFPRVELVSIAFRLYKNNKNTSKHRIKITFASVALSMLFVLPGFFYGEVCAQNHYNTGNLVGTIAFGDEKKRAFVEFSPETTIILSSRGRKQIISSNENGDYIPELLVGRYCITSILSKEGKKLRTWSNQNTCFNIRNDEVTRFDISLSMKNSELYRKNLSDTKVEPSNLTKAGGSKTRNTVIFRPILYLLKPFKFIHGYFGEN